MANLILPPMSGIYSIFNKVNGRRYVGSAVNFKERQKNHLVTLNKGVHHSVKLQNAWNFYGADNFDFLIIETVEDKSLLLKREQYWIDFYQSASQTGYNMLAIAGSHLGVKQSKEHIAARVAAHLGAKRSNETKEKIRQAALGRKQSIETIEKRVSKLRGKKLSKEHVEKVAKANTGRKNTPEAIAKFKAIIKTEQARKNMSLAAKGKKLSAESILKREATKKAKRLLMKQKVLTNE